MKSYPVLILVVKRNYFYNGKKKDYDIFNEQDIIV